MNPKNRFQHNIAILSQKLPGLTEAQRAWIWKHCIKHRGYRTKNGRISCLKCGHTWQSKNGYLLDTFCEIECPQCRAHFGGFFPQAVFHDTVYFCIVTTCKGYQVVRFFYLSIQQKVGEKQKSTRWKSCNIGLLRIIDTPFWPACVRHSVLATYVPDEQSWNPVQ